jgi:WD40 repeat protein
MTLLSVVASEDNTNFVVYNLTTGLQISEGHLDNMENQYTLLPNGTFFKVVSDKIVSVLLLEYGSIPLSNVTDKAPSTYYTSVDGLYVGKKFVFMVDEGSGGANDYTIFALEKSTITITKDDNSVNTISLDANAYKDWPFSPFRVYKIESTGNIMLWAGVIPQWGGDTNCFTVPCAEGGFVGKYFITKSITAYDPRRDYGYRISATEDAKVTVYDLETKQVIQEYDIVGGVGIGFQPPGANALFVQSDKPITLSFVHNGSIEQTRPLESSTAGGPYSAYGNAVSFIGVRANENTELYLPVQSLVEVYFFANQETHVTIDDTTHTIEANNYFVYTIPGNHMISSDKDIMVEINYWNGVPYYQGIMFTGAIIPCIETVSTNPNVTITPIGEGFPMMYIIIGGGVAAVAVIVGLLFMRRRGGKPS